MEYYWAIKWKSFTESDLLVNQRQAEYIDTKLDEPEGSRGKFFKVKGERYTYDDIRKIERTTIKINPDVKMLYDGEALKISNEPLYDAEGYVVTNWYKMLISPREYEQKYAKSSSYHIIDKTPDGYWVGVRCVEYEDSRRSDYLEICTELEAERLWRISSPVH